MNDTGVLVGHLDADCFYVSAERVRYPRLIGKPVGVLGNQGAIVIAKSYELKAYGVKTGEPVWDAYVKCPSAVYVKRDFRWYEILSRKMLDVVREMSPRVEYYSIDEFFFLAEIPPGRTCLQLAESIRDRVWREVGVPVTVGIAPSKTLAKLISDSGKPFGARAVVDRDELTAMLAGLPVTEISGIAGARARRLAPWNIATCLDLARADRGLIKELLTVSGETLWYELNGMPVSAIRTERPAHKTLSRGGSFGGATDDPRVIYAWLVRNLERLVEELRYHEVLAGRLAVWVGYKGSGYGRGRANLPAPGDRFDVLLETGRVCLREAYIPKAHAHRMHLFAEDLTPRSRGQLGLFGTDDPKAEAIARVKEEINRKVGRFAVRSGASLPLGHVYDDDAQSYDICDVHGKMCF